MGYTQIPITVVVATGLQVDPVTFKPAAGSIRPKISAETKAVLCAHFINADGTDYPLGASDTFEIGGDKDYVSDIAEGNLSGALNAEAVITSVVAKTGLATANIPDTGHIRLYNSLSVMERVEYTAFDADTLIFTVSHTMTSSYVDSDRLVVEDELMFYSGNDVVDVSGDWDDVDRAVGKVSIQIDATSDIFREKLAGAKYKAIYIEIRRYPVGQTVPSKMYQDTGMAVNTVIDSRGNPASTNPQFMTQSATDARYAQLTGASDIEIMDADKGVILKDRTTSTRYRIFFDNGILSYESIA